MAALRSSRFSNPVGNGFFHTPAFQVLLAVTALRNSPPFSELRSAESAVEQTIVCLSQRGKEVEHTKLPPCEASLFEEPTVIRHTRRNNAELRIHCSGFLLGRLHFGQTHEYEVLSLQSGSCS
jgi:hypothetical protein